MRINPSKIPEHLTIFHSGYIEQMVVEYFKDPNHQKEFEKWQERRMHEKEMVVCSSDDIRHLDGCGTCLAVRA